MSAYFNAGYDSSVFFMLLGPLFFLLVLYGLYLLFKKLLQVATTRCGENCFTRRLKTDNRFVLVSMRFLLESCLEIGLSAMICILLIDDKTFQDVWEATSTICAFLSLVLLFATPFIYYRMTRRYLKDIEAADGKIENSQVQNDEMFSAYRANLTALNYPTIFLVRRYLMLLILTLTPTLSLLQVFLHMMSTMGIAAYLGRAQPFQSRLANFIEIFNELTVFMAAYPLLTFTDWIDEAEDRDFNGWLIVSCICLNVVFNMTITLATMIKKAYVRIK